MRILIVFVVAILGQADTNTKSNSGNPVFDDRFADISEVPYQAALFVYMSQYCGGSVISDRYILTAAICVFQESNPKSYSVRVGSSHAHRGGTVMKVKKIIYEREKFHGIHDLALLQLEKPIPNFGTVVKSLTLDEPSKDINVGDVALLSGWGRVSEKGKPSKRLQKVKIPIVSYEDCKANTAGLLNITHRHICTKPVEGGQHVCLGEWCMIIL